MPMRSRRWASISTSRWIAPTATRTDASNHLRRQMPMGTTLEQFAAQCHDALKSKPGAEGRKAVCGLVKDVLKDGDFVARYIPEGTPERKVLYEDPELGFT